jgi:hypothetical protein
MKVFPRSEDCLNKMYTHEFNLLAPETWRTLKVTSLDLLFQRHGPEDKIGPTRLPSQEGLDTPGLEWCIQPAPRELKVPHGALQALVNSFQEENSWSSITLWKPWHRVLPVPSGNMHSMSSHRPHLEGVSSPPMWEKNNWAILPGWVLFQIDGKPYRSFSPGCSVSPHNCPLFSDGQDILLGHVGCWQPHKQPTYFLEWKALQSGKDLKDTQQPLFNRQETWTPSAFLC